jgi:hypothetical protein
MAGFSLLGVAYFSTGWPNPAALESCRQIPNFKQHTASLLVGLPISIHTCSAVVFFVAITLTNKDRSCVATILSGGWTSPFRS